MTALLVVLIVIVVILLIMLLSSMRVVQQYEKGIIFRMGRIQKGIREPGLTVKMPFIDRLQKVNMQIVAMGVPAQDGITRDNVSVRVDAVVYFRVVDPIKAVVNVQNYLFAVSQQAQTSLRQVIGRADLDQMLSERDVINRELRDIIDEPTEGPWGVRIERVEIKDVSLPEGMKRSMSRQAEAERERRARIISADGEYQASKRLGAAAHVMSADPASLQLRLLQTVVEVAAERNSTLVMPIPVEIMRFFEKMAPAPEPDEDRRREAEREVAEVEEQDRQGGPDIGNVPDVEPVDETDTPAVEGARQSPASGLGERAGQPESPAEELPAQEVRQQPMQQPPQWRPGGGMEPPPPGSTGGRQNRPPQPGQSDGRP